jgi:iron complex outermembrane recepter protein
MRHTRTLTIAAAVAAVLGTSSVWGEPLEEVIVTAQKREESLQDVPISVSAVSGDKIKEAGIRGLEDMSAYVPNFSVSKDAIGDKISIRGISSGTQAGFEQSVSTFVDGIYRGRGVQSRYAFLDVQSVEVLRGPQGTLFGKNVIGGAVNVRSAKPTDTLDGEVSATYNFDLEGTEVQGFISGPLTDTLRGRAVILDRSQDKGWVKNTAYNEYNSTSDELVGRVALDWDVTDATTVGLKYEHADFSVNGNPYYISVPGPLKPTLDAGGIAYGPNARSTRMGNNGFGPFAGDPVIDFGSNAKFDGNSSETVLNSVTQLDNGSTITAIAGYSEYKYKRFTDADFNPLPVIRFDDTEDYDQTSLEVRFASDVGGKFEYIGGAYYQQSDLKTDGLSQFNAVALNMLLGGSCASLPGALGLVQTFSPAATAIAVAGLPGSNAGVTNACAQRSLTQGLVPAGVNGAARYAYLDQNTETYAAFGQATWNITDRWRSTLGLRYTSESKEASQGAWAADYVERNTAPIANPSPANPAALAAYLFGEFTPHNFSKNDPGMSRDEDSFTWSANVQWDATDDTMLYGTASTGYKAGGFNSFYMGKPAGAGADSNDVDFNEEEVMAYELGAKMRLLDGTAELNVALFRVEYDGLQAAIFSGNTTFVVQNAAKATSQGLELDGRWAATDKLTLMGSFGWTDFKFDEFPNQACTASQFLAARDAAFQAAIAAGNTAGAGVTALTYNNQVCAANELNDLKGKTSDHTPEFSANLVANYVQPIGSYELAGALDVSYRDEIYTAGDLDPASLQDAAVKYNASIGFGPSTGVWQISLIGRNLSDERTSSYSNDMPLFNGAQQASLDQPRSIAVAARYRF